MEKMDWTYVTRERVKENVNALAIAKIMEIMYEAYGELTMEEKLLRIEGVIDMVGAVYDSTAREDKDDADT